MTSKDKHIPKAYLILLGIGKGGGDGEDITFCVGPLTIGVSKIKLTIIGVPSGLV